MADPGGTKDVKDAKDATSDNVNLRPNGGAIKPNNTVKYKTGSVDKFASKVSKGRQILSKKNITSVGSITKPAGKRPREMVSPP